MFRVIKFLIPLCVLGLGLGCEKEYAEEENPVEVGEDLGELAPVDEDDQPLDQDD